MRAAFRWIRHGFEAAGAVQLAAAGMAAVIGSVAAGIPSMPWVFRITVFVGVALLVAAVVVAARPRLRRTAWTRLGRDCLAYADELAAFVDQRRLRRPVSPRYVRGEPMMSMLSLLPTPEHRQHLAERAASERRHERETLSLYHEGFRVRGLVLLDRLYDLRRVDRAERNTLEQPRSSDDLSAIAGFFRRHADGLAAER